MKKSKRNKFLHLFAGIAMLSLVGIAVYIGTKCKNISCISIKNGENYKVKEVYEDNKYIYRALYFYKNTLLKAEIRSNYSHEDSKQLIEVQIARTKGLFEDAAAPYPGEISDVIACGDTYKPKYYSLNHDGFEMSYFEGYVNKRLVFGSCANDQAEYHDTLTMFYCPLQKRFYQLEIIIPNKDYKNNPSLNDEILKSISCNK